MINKTSVAGITAGLTKMVTQLETLEKVEEAKRTKADNVIATQRQIIDDSSVETARARQVRANLNKILGE
jgi:hypothetical protein